MAHVQHLTTINEVRPDQDYHYVIAFTRGQVRSGVEPINLEPHKCEGWHWVRWDATDFPPQQELFYGLQSLRSQGFSPFANMVFHPLI
eukprot:g23912.t1